MEATSGLRSFGHCLQEGINVDVLFDHELILEYAGSPAANLTRVDTNAIVSHIEVWPTKHIARALKIDHWVPGLSVRF